MQTSYLKYLLILIISLLACKPKQTDPSRNHGLNWDEIKKMLNITPEQDKFITTEVQRKLSNSRSKELLPWDDSSIPEEIRENPRLIFGRSRNPFIQKNNFEDYTFQNQKFKYDRQGKTLYSKDGLRGGDGRAFDDFKAKNNIEYNCFSSIGIEKRVYQLKQNDITIDISSKNTDIEGDAWDPEIIPRMENKLEGKKPQALIFERISLPPLSFESYIIDLLKNNKTEFYRLDYNTDPKLSFYKRDSTPKEVFYEAGVRFYPECKKEKIIIDNNQLANLNANQNAVYIKYPPKSAKIEYYLESPTLDEILQSKPPPKQSPILKKYFELLVPGGKVVFMSSSSGVYRHGGIVFKYKGHFYSPFKDLDDPNLKSIYKNMFEEAGFKDIEFHKDKYFMEDVLYITAKKP